MAPATSWRLAAMSLFVSTSHCLGVPAESSRGCLKRPADSGRARSGLRERSSEHRGEFGRDREVTVELEPLLGEQSDRRDRS
jgi:hypothetical protein